MERTLKDIEMDMMIEEAIIMNQCIYEFNKRQQEAIEYYSGKSKLWLLADSIRLSIMIRLVNIRSWIRVLFQ
jgi:hypothetical protein